MILGMAEGGLLAQLDFRLSQATKHHEGNRWVYKTHEEWGIEVGVPKDSTYRAVAKLIKRGLVISIKNPNKGWDKTKWYRIDYEALKQLCAEHGIEDLPTLGDQPESITRNRVKETRNRVIDDAPARYARRGIASAIPEKTPRENSREDSTVAPPTSNWKNDKFAALKQMMETERS
jgi:hypothetical protein